MSLNSGCGTGVNRPKADSCTVEMNSTVAEAPRPARDQRDGRSPGSRVKASCRLPDLSMRQTSVALGKCSPLTVAGAAVDLYRSAGALDSYHIPSSLSRMREAIKVCSTPLRRHVVNGGSADDATHRVFNRCKITIVAAGVMAYAAAVDRCSVPTSGSRRVKREAGASARIRRFIPALPPQR